MISFRISSFRFVLLWELKIPRLLRGFKCRLLEAWISRFVFFFTSYTLRGVPFKASRFYRPCVPWFLCSTVHCVFLPSHLLDSGFQGWFCEVSDSFFVKACNLWSIRTLFFLGGPVLSIFGLQIHNAWASNFLDSGAFLEIDLQGQTWITFWTEARMLGVWDSHVEGFKCFVFI